jgi:hypothetical protein
LIAFFKRPANAQRQLRMLRRIDEKLEQVKEALGTENNGQQQEHVLAIGDKKQGQETQGSRARS